MTLYPGQSLVTSLSGPELNADEAYFLRSSRPSGVILFARNLVDVFQIQELIRAIRGAVTPSPTLWLDQEGGRVQRLRRPLTACPSPGRFAELERHDPVQARELSRQAGWLNGRELATLGIGVNCAPVLDIRESQADPVIGERAFGWDPQQVIRLAGAWLEGFTSTGGVAVGKHFPGHGAARADSHKSLPRIEKDRHTLDCWELRPFRELLSRLPLLMTAHLVATGIDPQHPATWSAPLLRDILRHQWRYEGLLVSDALEMGALSGPLDDRAEMALRAGCDLVLCCTGRLDDSMLALAGLERALAATDAVPNTADISRRIERTLAPARIEPGDMDALLAETEYQRWRHALERVQDTHAAPDPTAPTH
ncbi:MAG: beta-N-acetylhexosaminidase [Magnetococcales bacterium]|nr:beta-N-acetylhexosaminidase [Magnetococcales bacterium]